MRIARLVSTANSTSESAGSEFVNRAAGVSAPTFFSVKDHLLVDCAQFQRHPILPARSRPALELSFQPAGFHRAGKMQGPHLLHAIPSAKSRGPTGQSLFLVYDCGGVLRC